MKTDVFENKSYLIFKQECVNNKIFALNHALSKGVLPIFWEENKGEIEVTDSNLEKVLEVIV